VIKFLGKGFEHGDICAAFNIQDMWIEFSFVIMFKAKIFERVTYCLELVFIVYFDVFTVYNKVYVGGFIEYDLRVCNDNYLTIILLCDFFDDAINLTLAQNF
jgi:hypothetical protein